MYKGLGCCNLFHCTRLVILVSAADNLSRTQQAGSFLLDLVRMYESMYEQSSTTIDWTLPIRWPDCCEERPATGAAQPNYPTLPSPFVSQTSTSNAHKTHQLCAFVVSLLTALCCVSLSHCAATRSYCSPVDSSRTAIPASYHRHAARHQQQLQQGQGQRQCAVVVTARTLPQDRRCQHHCHQPGHTASAAHKHGRALVVVLRRSVHVLVVVVLFRCLVFLLATRSHSASSATDGRRGGREGASRAAGGREGGGHGPHVGPSGDGPAAQGVQDVLGRQQEGTHVTIRQQLNTRTHTHASVLRCNLVVLQLTACAVCVCFVA